MKNKYSQNSSGDVKTGSESEQIHEKYQVHESIELNQGRQTRLFEKCIELHNNGCSINEIARQLATVRFRVRTNLRRAGIETNPKIREKNYTVWRKSRRTQAHPPFGYMYYLGKLVIQPREHEILLLIGCLAKDGKSSNAIAEYLNSKSLSPRSAKQWSRNSVLLILKRNV